MQNYDIYKQARDKAWEFLIENNISQLPVNLSKICRNSSYSILSDKNYIFLEKEERGSTFLRDGKWYIVLNPADMLTVQRYTIAHELGHIYLKHPLVNGKYGRTFGKQAVPNSDIEYQAERFAIDVLAPACVLWGLNLHSAKDISEACGISMTAARIRAERMELLYKRNMFLSHPLERQVFEQFKPFIKNR